MLSHIRTLVMAMKMVYETLVSLNQLMQLVPWDPIEFTKCKSFMEGWSYQHFTDRNSHKNIYSTTAKVWVIIFATSTQYTLSTNIRPYVCILWNTFYTWCYQLLVLKLMLSQMLLLLLQFTCAPILHYNQTVLIHYLLFMATITYVDRRIGCNLLLGTHDHTR